MINIRQSSVDNWVAKTAIIVAFLTCAGAFSLFIEGGARPQGIYNEGDVAGPGRYANYYYMIFIFLLPIYLVCRGRLGRVLKGLGRYSGFYFSAIVLLMSFFQWVDGAKFTAGGIGSILSLVSFGAIIYMAASMISVDEIFKCLNATYFVCLLLSLFLAVAVPSYGVTYYDDGSWQGMFNHKNNLGLFCASYAMAASSFYKLSRPLTVFNFLLALLLVIKSYSYTGTIAFGLGAVLSFLPFKIRAFFVTLKKTTVTIFLSVSVALVLLSISNFALKIADKDFSFSGRNAIWAYSLLEIKNHPLIGQGMNSMAYQVTANPTKFYSATGQVLSNEHNGFIGSLYNYGLLGLALILSVMRYDFSKIKLGSRYGYGFFSFIICLILINTLEERSLYVQLFYFWYLIYVLSVRDVYSLGRERASK